MSDSGLHACMWRIYFLAFFEKIFFVDGRKCGHKLPAKRNQNFVFALLFVTHFRGYPRDARYNLRVNHALN